MGTPQHQNSLKKYLNRHRDAQKSVQMRSSTASSHSKRSNQRKPWDSSTTTYNQKDEERFQRRTVHVIKPMPYLGRKATIDDLPDELMLKIFSYFLPGELLILARVCRRWLELSKDNLLWHRIYRKYVSGKYKQDRNVCSDGNSGFWKALCVKRCSETRNLKSIITRKKINRFTGLLDGTEQCLRKAGTKWIMAFVNIHNEEVSIVTNDDACHFSMATSVRWFCFPSLNLSEIVKMRIYAANPIFFDPKGLALPNSPCQRSLLHEQPFKWRTMKSDLERIARDESESIDLFIIDGGFLIATWKDSDDIAFITVAFHHHMLVERCLQGTNKSPYKIPPHVTRGQDIDRKLGLHSYACSLELRNHCSSLWKEQFLNLHCKDDRFASSGHVTLQLIHPDREYERSSLGKHVSLLWKTDALKGIVKDMCFLDITVLAESSTPMWCNSSPIKLSSASKGSVNYNYVGKNQVISWEDQRGKVFMLLIWEDDSQQYFITDVQVSINLQFVNRWFGTRH